MTAASRSRLHSPGLIEEPHGSPSVAMPGCAAPFGWLRKRRSCSGEIAFGVNMTAYVRSNPLDPDLKRKAYTAVAAKVARVVFGLIKSGKEYRRFLEPTVPAGESLRRGR